MKYRFFFALAAVSLLVAPAFAQEVDCDNIPTTAEAVPAEYIACGQPMVYPESNAGPLDNAFGYYNGGPSYVDFVQNAPETFNTCGAASDPSFMNAGDFAGDDLVTWYGLHNDGEAFAVNKNSACGETSLGTILPSNGGGWTGCTWDYVDSTFYCMAVPVCGGGTDLYEVDIPGGSATFIGTEAVNLACGIGIASEPLTGVLYAYGVVLDQLVTLSKVDGSATVVGPMPYDANFGQGLDFDNDDLQLYNYAFNFGAFAGELWIIDTVDPSGSSTLVGALGSIIPGGTVQMGAGSSQTLIIPVELVSFNAQTNGTNVTLNWATASETNNAGFEVQVQNGEGWDAMAWVEGHGTTTEAQTYSYTAEDLGVGTHTFRLKQIDFDGVFEYHGNVEVTIETPGTHLITSAYPNPFNPQSQFTLAVAQDQVVTAELFNTLGQRVAVLFNGTVEANQAQLVTIDGAGLASGVYVVRVTGERFSDALSVTLLK